MPNLPWSRPVRRSQGLPACLVVLLGLAALMATGNVGAGGGVGRAGRPNLLFILTDDQRFDTLGCAGNRVIRTPFLDDLARTGARFTNAFVTSPICAASRASILTGLWERTHRYTFGTPPLAPQYLSLSFPALLRKAGYRTGYVGKLGVGVHLGDSARLFDYLALIDRSPYHKRQPDGSLRHETDLDGDAAVEFINSCSPESPFSLSVAFNAPHAEDLDSRQYHWSRDEDSLYRHSFFPTPRTMEPPFFAALPEFLRKSESRVRYHWRFDEPRKYQEMVRAYYRMITGVDRVIGRIRLALQDRGLADNTIIVFCSDNGYFLGERGFADKWYGYEYSIRVPMIIHDPRLPPRLQGRELPPVALNVDIAPTLLDLAGLRPPTTMQGRSLAPWLRGAEPNEWRTEFLFEHLFDRPNIPKSEGVRTPQWTYIRWFEQAPVVEELYDHRADFEQEHNLAGKPEMAPVLARLREKTTRMISGLSPVEPPRLAAQP